MSNKYKTGSYQVLLFDQYGTLHSTLIRDNYLEAEQTGAQQTQAPPYASFVVTRVLTNSLDRAHPWTKSVEEQYMDPDYSEDDADGE